MNVTLASLVCGGFLLIGCTPATKDTPLKIATNPWPGYEFLHLAKEKKFFEEVGLNVELLDLASLSDAQRTYVTGHVDGLTSTIIEAVQAEILGGKPLQIVLVPDYSNGGDVIIANKYITTFGELKGKRIGCEISSLGIFVLQRALSSHGIDIEEVEVVDIAQSEGKSALINGEIDAFITYPPVSVELLDIPDYHQIFSSKEIPGEIIDTVSISKEYLTKHPKTVEKLHRAWQLALDYTAQHPDESYSLMANRERISTEDFKGVLTDLEILNSQQQREFFKKDSPLQTSVKDVCNVLVSVNAIEADCTTLSDLVYVMK